MYPSFGLQDTPLLGGYSYLTGSSYLVLETSIWLIPLLEWSWDYISPYPFPYDLIQFHDFKYILSPEF